MQLSCFFANLIIPPLEGVEIEIDLVWLPWRSSLLAFFKMGSNILKSGCNMSNAFSRYINQHHSILNRICKKQHKTNLANLIFKIVLRVYWYVVLKDVDGILWLLISLMIIYRLILVNHHKAIPLPPYPSKEKKKNGTRRYLGTFCSFNNDIRYSIPNIWSGCSISLSVTMSETEISLVRRNMVHMTGAYNS